MDLRLPNSPNLLDQAVSPISAGGGRVVLVEDCVEASGAFVLHHLLKRALIAGDGIVLFVALAQPFSHYDRILKKLGCNLTTQKDKNRFFFFDMLKMESPGTTGGLVDLYGKLHQTAKHNSSSEFDRVHITVMLDDVSLLEVASHGVTDHVLDFLHYCHTLTFEQNGSLIMLNHDDIYSSLAEQRFILQLKYLADIVIKADPLATGLASDVHGKLTVLNKKIVDDQGQLVNKINAFHFKVKENNVEFFLRGAVVK